MNKEDFETAMIEAKVRVMEMDRIDGYRDRSLRTVVFALESGLRNPDSSAQFEALSMLYDILSEQ